MLRSATLLLAALAASPQDAPDGAPEDGSPAPAGAKVVADGPIALSIDPATELWFEVRTRAASADVPADGDPLAEPIAVARELNGMFSEQRAWLQVDAFVLEAKLPGGFAAVFTEELRIPKSDRVDGARPALVAEAALRLARAIDEATPRWLEETWPARRARLEEGFEALCGSLTHDAQLEVLAELDALFRLPRPEARMHVRIATEIPEESALLLRSGNRVAFVGLEGRSRGDVLDVVLHEVMHLMQNRPFYPPSMLSVLDGKLAANKVRDERSLDATHVLFYLASGELCRRIFDPEHVDQGETGGFYERAPGLVEQLRPLWERYARGEVSGGDFTDSYAATAAAWFAQGGEFSDE